VSTWTSVKRDRSYGQRNGIPQRVPTLYIGPSTLPTELHRQVNAPGGVWRDNSPGRNVDICAVITATTCGWKTRRSRRWHGPAAVQCWKHARNTSRCPAWRTMTSTRSTHFWRCPLLPVRGRVPEHQTKRARFASCLDGCAWRTKVARARTHARERQMG